MYCDELWDVEWRTASRWTGRVYLDGTEVTEDCCAVGYRGDIAAYLCLYRRNDAGAFFSDVSGRAASVVRIGAIGAELTPLPEAAVPLAWADDANCGAASTLERIANMRQAVFTRERDDLIARLHAIDGEIAQSREGRASALAAWERDDIVARLHFVDGALQEIARSREGPTSAPTDNAALELVALARAGEKAAFLDLAACLMPAGSAADCWRGTRQRLGLAADP